MEFEQLYKAKIEIDKIKRHVVICDCTPNECPKTLNKDTLLFVTIHLIFL